MGEKNGVQAKTWTFLLKPMSSVEDMSGNFNEMARRECAKSGGMKPICDHPSWCKADSTSYYIGQNAHFSHGGHRNTLSYFPSGWSNQIAEEFYGICTYTGGNTNAICEHSKGSHAWKTLAQTKAEKFSFVCGIDKEVTYGKEMINEGYPLGEMLSNGCTTEFLYLSGASVEALKSAGAECVDLYNIGVNAEELHGLGCSAKELYDAQHDFQFGLTDAGMYSLGNGFNNMKAAVFDFKLVDIPADQGSTAFGDLMVTECNKVNMKPVCDHPSWCLNDAKSLYVGQQHHFAHGGHRHTPQYWPQGWTIAMADYFNQKGSGICTYTAKANGNNAICENANLGSHEWRSTQTAINLKAKFVCAQKLSAEDALAVIVQAPAYSAKELLDAGFAVGSLRFAGFTAKEMRPIIEDITGGPEGVLKGFVDGGFKADQLYDAGYSAKELKAFGFDCEELQEGGYPAAQVMQAGYNVAELKAAGYTAKMCVDGGVSVADMKSQFDIYSIVQGGAKISDVAAANFAHADIINFASEVTFATLGARNGVSASDYTFIVTKTTQNGGIFSTASENACSAVGMKPICDHRSYCKTNPKALYIGQDHHFAYPPHRRSTGYFPSGWNNQELGGRYGFFENVCTYCSPASNSALCAEGDSHAWRQPTPGRLVACGKKGKETLRVIKGSEFKEANIAASTLYVQGVRADDNELVGAYSVQELKNAGYKAYELADAGATASDLRGVGYNVAELRGDVGPCRGQEKSGMISYNTGKATVSIYCDMEPDFGIGYSYYKVVGGKNTWRASDSNTCKDLGMQIFVPRTKEHWKSAMKYTGGDNGFFYIMGVIRDSNGCGTCTNVAMNSKAMAAAGGDWHAIDNGDFWVRDTKYGEPNGDYHAGCWLGYYGFDLEAGTGYNDGNCGYYTSKYLCMSVDDPGNGQQGTGFGIKDYMNAGYSDAELKQGGFTDQEIASGKGSFVEVSAISSKVKQVPLDLGLGLGKGHSRSKMKQRRTSKKGH